MGYLRPTYQEAFFTLKVVCSNWHHLVGTYNNGVWSIYVDGVLESSYISVSPGTFAGFSHPIYIGRSASGSNAVGRMKEVSLWNYAKPPSQIQAEFKTKYTGNETGLEGYWKLDVSGSTALDLSPNNRTMTAYSVIWNTHNDFTRTFTADKKSHSDYYPFGMQMPGRTGNLEAYSYGFQGMEQLDDPKGNGNEYTTEYRQYDPRLGRWTSVDPLMAMFPGTSPYVAYANNPILYTDPLGLAPDVTPETKTNKTLSRFILSKSYKHSFLSILPSLRVLTGMKNSTYGNLLFVFINSVMYHCRELL